MRVAVIVAAALVAAVVTGCGSSSGSGGSSSNTSAGTTHAANKACSAMNDVKTQVSKLQGLTSGAVSPTDAAAAVQALETDFSTIKAQASKLTGTMKANVQSANDAFSSELNAVVSSVTSSSSTSLSAAASKLATAAQKLGDSYRQALSDVHC